MRGGRAWCAVADPADRRPRDRMSLICAQTSSELAEIGTFRQAAYAAKGTVTIDEVEAADIDAYVFGLRGSTGMLACARVLPLPHDEAGISRFDHPLARSHGMQTEVGRLATATGGSPRLVLAMLALGSYWMVEHTDHRSYVAYCNPRLASLYEGVGARDLGVETLKPGSDRPYRLVVGSFERTAQRLLAYLGYDFPADLIRPPAAMSGAA